MQCYDLNKVEFKHYLGGDSIMYEVDTREITGVKIFLNKDLAPGTVKPRSLNGDELEVSEDVYNLIKNKFQEIKGCPPRCGKSYLTGEWLRSMVKE